MHYLQMTLVGLLVGAIAKFITPGDDHRSGIAVTVLLGIGGSIVADILGRAFGWYHQDEPTGFIASIGGAVILLALYRAIVVSGLGARLRHVA
jgi:uncharacterized membrane protein YeaQ/YmgE (transglycosylase-associated protein family)